VKLKKRVVFGMEGAQPSAHSNAYAKSMGKNKPFRVYYLRYRLAMNKLNL